MVREEDGAADIARRAIVVYRAASNRRRAMDIRSFLDGLFSSGVADVSADPGPAINSATGLPMMDGTVDVAGNPFGVDLHR